MKQLPFWLFLLCSITLFTTSAHSEHSIQKKFAADALKTFTILNNEIKNKIKITRFKKNKRETLSHQPRQSSRQRKTWMPSVGKYHRSWLIHGF